VDSGIAQVVEVTDESIVVTVGQVEWALPDGYFVLEKDYRVGEIWRVHKNDPDPFPSQPHAHCVGGASRYIGCKLHLGTAELFRGREALGRYMNKKQFDRLIGLIRPKFPGLTLPLEDKGTP
jgi:hypothetical protein